MLELGYAYLSSLSLPEIAEPHLERLAAEVRESSSVSVLDGDEIVYVGRVPTSRIMRVSINVGTRFPAYATSMGRVLLAAPADDRARGLPRPRRDPAADRRARSTTPTALRAELDRIRAQGWALVDQELEEGLRSVAAPIRGRERPRRRRRQRLRARQPRLPREGPARPAAAAAGRPPSASRPTSTAPATYH